MILKNQISIGTEAGFPESSTNNENYAPKDAFFDKRASIKK